MDFPEVDQSLLSTLPPVLRAIVKALGFARAQEWLRLHGGVNINLPQHFTHTLGLSNDELQRMRVTLAPHLDENGRFYCPKIDKLWIRHRNAAIVANKDWQSGAKQARAYLLSIRQITNIRRQADSADMQQVDLFE